MTPGPRGGPDAMSDDDVAKFKNDRGVSEIRIGVREFKCIGVSPPLDHPHIYLEMGAADTIRCPYCATVFRHDGRLGPHEADPPDCAVSAGPGAD